MAPTNVVAITGPDTRNASWAAGPNCTNDAATNASDSEQSESTVASPIITAMSRTGVPATFDTNEAGRNVWTIAAAAAPTNRYRPMNRKSLPVWRKNLRHRASGGPD